MMEKKLRIVFMGTPEFAVPSLKILVESGYKIPAVITSPDKPSGRGLLVQQSAVKRFATQHNIPVLQPEKLKDPKFIEQLRSFRADLQVIVAFRMLPEVIWNMPQMGTINLHASLLPDYRGAAPINWAIINGERKTGVTTFFLKHEIDTGDMLLQQKVEIEENETAGSLHDKLMITGAGLVLQSVEMIENKNYIVTPQNLQTGKSAPKIFKEHCQIDWSKDVVSIKNLIHGLSPHPAAFTKLDEKFLKVFKAHVLKEAVHGTAGTVLTDGKTYLKFAAADGFVYIDELQAEGKKKMTVEEFIRGYRK
ncbi:MAG: methionyl-tRNA formyltransferase [Chitinophagales bacterium]